MRSRGRRQLTLATLLSFTFLLPSTSGAKGFKLFDANNKQVGEVMSITPLTGNQAVVAVKVNGQKMVFIADPSSLRSFSIFRLWFQSPDTTCAGTPLIQVASSPGAYFVLPPGVLGPPGTTLYIPDPNAAPQTISVGSQFGSFGCQSGTFSVPDLVPALAVIDLDTLFTPPFRVEGK